MLNRLDLNQQLHEFPVPSEMEGVDFVRLAETASQRFDPDVIQTRLEASEVLSHGTSTVLVKRVDELPGGCFKFLSAMNAVAPLVSDGHSEVVFPTAGSFGVAVGHAIRAFGGRATAYMPADAGSAKRAAMHDLGVNVIEHDGNFDETLIYAREHAELGGKKFLHPFASRANIAATGIVGLQLVEEVPEMTDLVLQFGGGSLTSGVASVVKKLRPDVRITVAQVAGCSPFVDSVLSGEVRESKDPWPRGHSYFSTLGGVGVGRTDPMTLGIASRVVDVVGTRTSDHVYGTMHDYERGHGVLPEFAAALGLDTARALARARGVDNATIVALLTGSNPENYQSGYLARMSARRQEDERYRKVFG